MVKVLKDAVPFSAVSRACIRRCAKPFKTSGSTAFRAPAPFEIVGDAIGQHLGGAALCCRCVFHQQGRDQGRGIGGVDAVAQEFTPAGVYGFIAWRLLLSHMVTDAVPSCGPLTAIGGGNEEHIPKGSLGAVSKSDR